MKIKDPTVDRMAEDFSGYTDCFTLVYRREKRDKLNPDNQAKAWKRVPSNTLVEGDVIKLYSG
jgi:hypothetical protein